MKPQTKNEIKAILDESGLRPNRRLGQNFLVDGNLMLKLADAAGVTTTDVVLEVGAGTGSLTSLLLDRAGHVVAVEVDGGLYRVLEDMFRARNTITLINGDVLENKSNIESKVLDAVDAARAGHSGRLMLVSNLPYHVATPLLIDVLASGLPFDRFCFSVQKEVGDKMLANHGSKQYGPMSIVLQATCSMERVFALPKHVFWPAPKIDSVVMRMDVDMRNFDSTQEFKDFVAFVRMGFVHRRKTLAYNLKSTYDPAQLERTCDQVGIDLKWRAEQLSVTMWLELFFALA